QNPGMLFALSVSLSPATSVILIGVLLNSSSPRATDLRCSTTPSASEPPMLIQARYRSKIFDVNGKPFGFPKEGGKPEGTGSLMPTKNPASSFASASGPPVAPAALRYFALRS